MLDDFRHFIAPAKWDSFERRERAIIAERGEIVNIKDVYSADGKELLDRLYQRESQIGTDCGTVLSSAVAGVENLNALLEGM
jgi:hypothetical protein